MEGPPCGRGPSVLLDGAPLRWRCSVKDTTCDTQTLRRDARGCSFCPSGGPLDGVSCFLCTARCKGLSIT
ncbi:hypothetical protein EYF80_047365 [Liparis tanakae]|uniref:Uncharacterized protein n=1 Tax=Liparis tanakae TaxID=230148 RepID=A0A4Z2FMV3_9TELE|nr:hypothetical protein EYF80_047365 [Liparis tanakae]